MPAPPRYHQDGFASLGVALAPQQLAELRAALDAWQPDATPRGDYGILHHNLWRTLAPFAATLHEGALGRVAAELLGVAEVVLFQDNLIWKPPGTHARVQWHQDFAYWPLSAPHGVTFWLALDDADEESGCLHYLPGSHHLGERQPTNFITPGAASWRQELPPLDWEHREPTAVPVRVRAGELLAHDPLVWHMSPGNRSHRQRRAWSLTWLTADVRWDPDHAPHPFNYFLRPTPGAELRGELFPRF